MKKNIIEETNERIQKLLNDRRAEIEKREGILQNAQAKKAAAAKKKAAAIQADDASAYSKARAEESEAQDLIEMTEAKIKYLNSQPYISEQEGREIEAAILATIAKAEKDYSEKIVKTIEALVAEGAESKSLQFSGNKVLTELHYEILKDNNQPPKYTEIGAWKLVEQIINIPKYKEYSGIDCTVINGLKLPRRI